MISAGYMFKKISPRPSWVKNKHVENIYSVSSCCSDDFTDYINYWKHNGYWLFNNVADMDDIIKSENLDSSKLTLFYYEAHKEEYDEDVKSWVKFENEKSFETNIIKPETAKLHGYDVVTFTQGTSPECSPLSCNSFADEIDVNKHCLFGTFSEAKEAIESGVFTEGEPGPYRIFSVYLVDKLRSV